MTAPTTLWPGLPELICDTDSTMPKPGDCSSLGILSDELRAVRGLVVVERPPKHSGPAGDTGRELLSMPFEMLSTGILAVSSCLALPTPEPSSQGRALWPATPVPGYIRLIEAARAGRYTPAVARSARRPGAGHAW